MAQPVMVNNIDHKDFKIDTRRSAELGDNLWYTNTFPQEFRSVQAHYPIFFVKDNDTGQFTPVALFGFKSEENLFLSDKGWDASYIPAMIARQPFTIGLQNKMVDGNEIQDRVLTLDLEHPRVNKDTGESLFLEFGGNSDYLDKIADMMEALHHGLEDNKNFIDCLNDLELLEPFTLEVQLNNGSKHEMVGFYTINEEKLNQLEDAQLAGLMKSGYMFAIHMVLASQGNVAHLLKRKNQQLGL